MINMIKAELYRLTKSKGFYIFWGCAVFTFMISVLYHEPGGITFSAPLEYGDGIKMDVAQLAMNFSYYFFLIIPVFCIISSEYSEHTIKNTITSAISRKEYFLAKFTFTMLYSLLSFMAANYMFYFVNKAVNGSKYSSAISTYSKALFCQIPLFIAIISLFIFLAFLLRKGAAFNAVTIITPIVYTSVALTLYGMEGTKKIAEKLLTYEAGAIISKLTLECTDSYRTKSYIVSVILTILSFVAGYVLFTKRELD